jgi:hypothetical protein
MKQQNSQLPQNHQPTKPSKHASPSVPTKPAHTPQHQPPGKTHKHKKRSAAPTGIDRADLTATALAGWRAQNFLEQNETDPGLLRLGVGQLVRYTHTTGTPRTRTRTDARQGRTSSDRPNMKRGGRGLRDWGGYADPARGGQEKEGGGVMEVAGCRGTSLSASPPKVAFSAPCIRPIHPSDHPNWLTSPSLPRSVIWAANTAGGHVGGSAGS